ncbi:MAG: hypothetical protein JWN15_2105 [Firmicutes bacterium]|nr:hypothetical protein [Bacillota bacterium]
MTRIFGIRALISWGSVFKVGSGVFHNIFEHPSSELKTVPK